MIKKLISAILSVVMLGALVPNIVFAEEPFNESIIEEEDDSNYDPADWIDDSVFHGSDGVSLMSSTKNINRYTVLTLDVSGSMGTTEMTKMKEASIAFCNTMLSARGNNMIAVVKFGSSSSVACGFTNDLSALEQSINSLSSSGGTDTAGGLSKAGELYDSLGLNNITERNIILISDGYPNSASSAQSIATSMWADYNIYTLGYDLPSDAQSFMQSIQNCGFYNVVGSDDITNAIKSISDAILAGASGNIQDFLANTTTVTVYKNKKGASSVNDDFVLCEGAKVTVNNSEYTTNASGNVQIPTVTSGSIFVTMDGYVPKTVSAAAIEENSKVYLQKRDGNNPVINSVMIGNTDILYSEYEIDLTESNPITLNAEVICENSSLSELYLFQDGKKVSFNGTSLTTIIKDNFDVSSDIYIIAKDQNGNTSKKVLKFKAGGKLIDGLSGFKFSMGDNRSFTLPDSCGLLAGSQVGIGISSKLTDLIPVEITTEDNKVYVSIGIDVAEYTNEDKFASNKLTGNKAHVLKKEVITANKRIKDLFDTSKDFVDTSDITKSWTKMKNLKSIYKNAIKYPRGSFGVEADFTILGFAEAYIDSNNDIHWVDGGVVLSPSASVNWGGSFAIGPVPCYWEAAIAAEVRARMNLSRNDEMKSFIPNGTISGELSASIGAGAGVKKLLSVGGGIKGSLLPEYILRLSEEDYFRLDASLSGYLEATFIGFSYKYPWDIANGTWIEYPNSRTAVSLASADAFDIYNEDNYELIDRSYAENPSEFTANNVSLFSEQNITDIKTNIYTYSEPKMIQFEDGSELIIWLDDVSGRADADRTAVYYTYQKNGIYSEPRMIHDDGTADFYPQLKLINDTAYVVWNNEKSTMSSEDMTEMTSKLEASAAVFDKTRGEFELYNITSNDTMDIYPCLFGEENSIYCIWLQNESNSVYVNDGYKIMLSSFSGSEWSTAEVYAADLASVESLSGYVHDGDPIIAYCIDTDGDINTTSDTELYVDNRRITENEVTDSNAVFSDGRLYWYGGGAIYEMNIFDFSIRQITPQDVYVDVDDFKVIENGNYKYIVFIRYDEIYSELFGYVYDFASDSWGNEMRFTDIGEAISSFDAYAAATGELNFIINSTEAIGDYENNNIYGQTDLKRITDGHTCNISIDTVDFNEEYLVEGNDFEITASVRNSGTGASEAFTIKLSDSDGQVIASADQDPLIPGEIKNITLVYTLENGFDGGDFDVTVETSDNILYEYPITMKYEDIAVENMSYAFNESGDVIISADIVNRGHGNGSSIEVSLRQESEDGSVEATKTVSVDELLDSENVSFEVNGVNNSIYYVTIDSDDNMLSNNSDYIIIDNLDYEIVDGNAVITKCSDYTEESIIVPSTIDGYTVTGIGSGVYEGCEKLKSISLPDTIKSIGDNAFANCSMLTDITIPASVEYIGSDVFAGDVSLEKINVQEDNSCYYSEDGVLYSKMGETVLIKYPAGKSGKFSLPQDVKIIADSAFSDCVNLKSVELADISQSTSCAYAFRNCSSLESVQIGKGSVIDEGMFINCISLKSISLPEGIKEIKSSAFKNCSALTEVIINDDIEKIAEGAFEGCTGIETLTLPFAGGSASDNRYLGYIFGASSYSQNSQYIPSSLTELTLTNGHSALASNALYGCGSIKTVTVSNERIESDAFRNCGSLTDVTLTYKVINISAPFSGCPSNIKISGYSDTAAEEYALSNLIEFIELGEIPHEEYVSGTCGYDFTWILYYDRILNINGIGIMPDYSSASSYPWYSYRSYIREVEFAPGTTSIGSYSMAGYPYLMKLTIPDTVKTINQSAFMNSAALDNIAVPSSVIEIGVQAFRGCTGLKNIILGENLLKIRDGAFYGCSALPGISIPDKVTQIDAQAFYNCTALKEVDLSNTLNTIGDSAFYNCTSIDSMVLPYTVTSISSNAFGNHTAEFMIKGYSNSYAEEYALQNSINFEPLDEEMPEDIRDSGTVGNDISWTLAYDGKLTVTGVGTMPNLSSSSYSWYKYRSSIKSINIEDISGIGSNAFRDFVNLVDVRIGQSVKTIEESAFYGCTNLENIVLSDNLKSISTNAFYNCKSLKHIEIPSSVKKIDARAFYNCTSLEDVQLCENLDSISDEAFYNCTAITNIIIPYTVVSISSSAFNNCAASLVIKGYADSYAQDYAKARGFAFEALEGNMPDAVRASGTLGNDYTWELTYDGTLNISGIGEMPSYSRASDYGWYQYSTYVKNVIIDEGAVTVGSYAFSGYTNLKTVSMPSTLTSIGNNAFYNCKILRSVIIPDNVTNIGSYAFYKCSELEQVTMSNKLQNLGDYSFAECVMLKEITLPYTVTTIYSNAFDNHISSFTIKGYAGSYAENYAVSKNIPFSAIDEVIPDVIRASGSFGDDFRWELSYNGTLRITGTGAMPSYSRASYYAWYSYRNYITAVEFGDGITSIGSYALEEYIYLQSVEMPDTLKTIGSYAFSGCSKLVSISVPNSVTNISDYAFNNCIMLAEIDLSDRLESMGAYAFSNCTAIEKIEIPYTVTSMSSNTFNNHLVRMVIKSYPSTYVEDYARANNITFEALSDEMPSEIYKAGVIGNNFSWSITYGGTLTVSGNGAMPNYGNSSSYTWRNYSAYVKRIVIVNSVTSIGSYAFAQLNKASDVSIPESVRTIGSYAFYNDTALTNVLIADGITSIDSYAFAGCTALEEIEIPATVHNINSYAFADCSKLSEVILSNGIESIGSYAFSNCVSMYEIFIPYTVTSISSNTFNNHSARLVIKGYTSSYAQDYAEANSIAFETVSEQKPDEIRISKTLGNDIVWELTYGGELRIKGIGSMPDYSSYDWSSYSTYIKKVVVQGGITSIGTYSFANLSNLEEVIIPSTVKTISAYAFDNARSLNKVDIADGTTVIKEYAFRNCIALETINMPETLESIGSYAFYGCSALNNVMIPENVSVINSYAFADCTELTNIMIPYKVVNIYSNTFNNHHRDLTISGYADSYAQDYADSNNIMFKAIESDYDEARAKGTIGNDFTWTLSYDGTLTISGLGAMPAYSSYDWQAYSAFIKHAVINEGVTSVGTYLFNGLTKLSDVQLPLTIKNIGRNAFYGCTSLTYIDLPDSVKNIDSYAFANCTALKIAEFPDRITSIGSYAFNGCGGFEKFYYDGSELEWNQVTIGGHNTPLEDAQGIFNSDNVNYDDFTFARSEDTVTASITAVNAVSGDMLAVAVYNADGTLKGLSMHCITETDNIISVSANFAENEKARAFIWNKNMAPYIAAQEIVY